MFLSLHMGRPEFPHHKAALIRHLERLSLSWHADIVIITVAVVILPRKYLFTKLQEIIFPLFPRYHSLYSLSYKNTNIKINSNDKTNLCNWRHKNNIHINYVSKLKLLYYTILVNSSSNSLQTFTDLFLKSF